MRAALLALGCVFIAWTARAAPIMSEPVTVDHGLRYIPSGSHIGRTQAIRVPSGVLLTSLDGNGIEVIRRGPNLEELERKPGSFGSPVITCGSFDIASVQSDQLAVFFDAGDGSLPKAMTIRRFDSKTLASIGSPIEIASGVRTPDLGGNSQATLRANAQVVLAAWLQADGTAHLARLNHSFERLDSTDIVIPNTTWRGPFALELDDDGGWLMGGDTQERLVIFRLDAEGHPTPWTVNPFDTQLMMNVAAERVGQSWLLVVAGQESVRATWVKGDLVTPFVLPSDFDHYSGLAIAAHDSTAAVVHRAGSGERIEAFVVNEGDERPRFHFYLATSGDVSWTMDRNRPVDVIWDGNAFLALWAEHIEGPVEAVERRDDWQRLPVSARRFSATEGALDPEPVAVNGATQIYYPALAYVDGRLRASCHDGFGRYRRIAVTLDDAGQPIAPGVEYVDAELDEVGSSWLGAQRMWGGAQTLLYSVNYSIESAGAFIDDNELLVVRLSPSGTVERSVWTQVDTGDAPAFSTHSYDLAGTDDSLFIAYDRGFRYQDPTPPTVHLRFLDGIGRLRREWIAHPDSGASAPTLRSAPGGALVVWCAREDGFWKLRGRVVRADEPTDTLGGALLLAEEGNQTAPWLIDGPDGYLCVYRHGVGTDGSDIRAIRLSPRGERLGTSSLRLCSAPGNQVGPTGVWDGEHYVVFWGEYGAARALYANRVRADGRVMDGDGFLVLPDYEGRILPATDGQGRVAVMQGDQLRFLEDAPVPTLPAAPSLTSRDDGIALAWSVSSEYVGARCSIYRRELDSPDEPIAPPEGFDRRALPITQTGPTENRAFDPDVEPSHWYAYAIELEAGGTSLWTSIATIQAGSSPKLSLLVTPNPIRRDGVISLRLPFDSPRAVVDVFDPAGRRVDRVTLAPATRGLHAIAWPDRARAGSPPAGVYLVRATVGSERSDARVIVIR